MTELADPVAEEHQAASGELPLYQQLDALVQCGADSFDPVRFCYLEAMVRRAREQPAPVAQIVERKAREALAIYQRDQGRAKQDAEGCIERIAGQFTASADQARCLFSDGDFNGVRRLEAGLSRDRQLSQGSAALAGLTDQILQSEYGCGESQNPSSLDDLIRQQEQEILRSTANAVAVARPVELKSVRLFRESWVKIQSDQRVVQAVEEGPENPGPLNQEKLAIATLTALRDLSPRYLSRFVSHIDTLLWLEQADQHNTAARKKAARKSKTKRGSRKPS